VAFGQPHVAVPRVAQEQVPVTIARPAEQDETGGAPFLHDLGILL
jgi:hypothetical protein